MTKNFSLRAKQWIARVGTSVCCIAAAALPYDALAAFACQGKVGYLGVDAPSGDVIMALAGSTDIHRICSLANQAGYASTVPGCKAIHATLLSAKLSDRPVTVYYNSTGGCSQIPAWGTMQSMYFVEGS